MSFLVTAIILGAVCVGIYFVMRRNRPTLNCTRCDGTGDVNERWPDPKEEGGWHIVQGTCPKCAGRGRITVKR